jgi:glutamate-1-semialdehyde aminotransferase
MYECCSAARGYTKRDKIIKLQDVITVIQILLIQALVELLLLVQPTWSWSNRRNSKDTLLATYNDI